MNRRAFLAALAAALAASGGCAPLAPLPVPAGRRAGADRFYVPGYATADARIGGRPALDRLGGGVAARDTTLLTRVDPDGGVKQAIFRIVGHDVTIAPDGRIGLFGRMGATRDPADAHHLAFDTETLEEVARGLPPKPGWRGGGHGLFHPDSGLVLTAERAPVAGYRGRPEAHFGRIALREPETLRVIDTISCHGIDPHEIRLLPGGRQVAVANYGSVAPSGATELGLPRTVVEASLTVVDLDSGALVAKHLAPDPEMELRHLAAGADGTFFAIRARIAPAAADPAAGEDITADPGEAYLPAAPLLVVPGGPPRALGGGLSPEALRHGLSVEYDAHHDQFLATFPTAHRVLAFDGTNGALRAEIDTRRMGLPFPCGLALLADGLGYAVAGSRADVLILDRASHGPRRLIRTATGFHGHSHMTVA